MAERQLKLYAQTTAGGTKTTTTTISNVNPAIESSTTLRNFGQMLNAFTTNTYQKTDLVETTNVDTEDIGPAKRVPTLNITSTTVNVGETHWDIDFECDSDAVISRNIFGRTNSFIMGGSQSMPVGIIYDSATNKLRIEKGSSGSAGATIVVYVACAETDTCYAATTTATLTSVRS